jgi:hypothetical protein
LVKQTDSINAVSIRRILRLYNKRWRTAVDREKRRGDAPVPDNLQEVLNVAQWQALPGIKLSGWELRFIRKRLFMEPVPVLRNRDDNRTGILGPDGKIDLQTDIELREEKSQAQTPPSGDTLLWTK